MKTFEQRFWRKVDRRSEEECWEWTGAIWSNNYGQIWRDGKKVRAHRVAWELTHGRPIPAGMVVCHRCDNPLCCNPAHLLAGTQAENVRDIGERGRRNDARGSRHGSYTHPESRTPGEQNGNAVLTEAAVLEMRRLRRTEGWSYRQLAEAFGVGQMTAYEAVVGITWKHLQGEEEQWAA